VRKEGNNPYNNRIIVDYEKKTIKFIPIGKKGIRKYYMLFLLQIFMFYILVFLYPLIILHSIMSIFLKIELNALLVWDFMMITTGSMTFSLYYFNKEWRKKTFPELNYKLIKFCKLLMFKKEKKHIIEPKAIHNKTVIIPEFSNVMLHYETTGDFSKYLKKVKIMNVFKANPWKWNCCFEFGKTPKKGMMSVKYI